MICPGCNAEYRPGFTRCSDCDVELVSSLEERFVPESEESPTESRVCDRLLWSGKDVDVYLSLIRALEEPGVSRLGRAMRPLVADAGAGKSEYSLGDPEFGVWTSEKDLFLGNWIVKSLEENRAEDAAYLKAHLEDNGPDPDDTEFPEGWKCVLCKARYADDSSACPNCGVALRRSGAVLAEEEEGRNVSSLPNVNFAHALRVELGKLGVPFNNMMRSGGNFLAGQGRGQRPSYDVRVLGRDYGRAKEVLARLLQGWEFGEGLGLNPSNDVLRTYWPVRAEENRWLTEDLTVEVWDGTNYFRLIGVCQALREHEIPYTLQLAVPGSGKIMLHPEDEGEAKEIIREINKGVLSE